MYRQLAADRIHRTVQRLERRLAERFPRSSLLSVARELTQVSAEALERTERIRRPLYLVRTVVWLLLLSMVGVLVLVPLEMKLGEVRTVLGLVQVLEPALGTAFFLGALVASLWTIELRLKRARALRAIHELRSLAHVVDMHQLTKDPAMTHEGRGTASSPQRTMSDFELYRYLDYCTEMLSLISKIAALYVQGLPDAQAVAAVDDIEDLCTGLSRKIWQKAILIGRGVAAPAGSPP